MSQILARDVRTVFSRGIEKGLRSSWELIKVIAPVSLGVTALNHTPLLPWVSAVFEPLMRWLGLSGEAAVVLVAGNAVGLYSAIGAMTSLEFGPKELLILALMLSFSHNVLVETAVTKRLGVSYWGVLAYRAGLALIVAVIVNAVYGWLPGREPQVAEVSVLTPPGASAPRSPTTAEPARPGEPSELEEGAHPARLAEPQQSAEVIPAPPPREAGLTAGVLRPAQTEQPVQPRPSDGHEGLVAAVTGWVAAVLRDAAGSLIRTVALLIAIIIPLMVIIEALKVTGILEALSRRIEPYMGWLGMSGAAGFPLLAGFVFGLAYGAGVILEAAKENDLTQGDRRLLCVFLVACHAAIEDTVLFIPLGVNPALLLGTRLALALLLTIAAARAGLGTRRPDKHAEAV